MTNLQMADGKDAELEEAIGRTLDAKAKMSWIKVMVRKGYVNLFGFVDGSREKREISEIVQSLPGVQMVTNHLHVKIHEEQREAAHF